MRLTAAASISALIMAALLCTPAHAATNGFTEGFSANDAGWRGFTTSQLVSHHGSGGVSDGGYISHLPSASIQAGNIVGPVNPTSAAGVIIFRAGSGASGGAFLGDYVEGGVSLVQAYVNHNFTEKPIDFYVRLSAGPAAVFFGDRSAPANQWTLINFAITPQNYSNAGGTFEQVVPNVTNFQIGAMIRGPVTSPGTPIQFSLDQVSQVPEPSSLALAFGGALYGFAARRRRAR